MKIWLGMLSVQSIHIYNVNIYWVICPMALAIIGNLDECQIELYNLCIYFSILICDHFHYAIQLSYWQAPSELSSSFVCLSLLSGMANDWDNIPFICKGRDWMTNLLCLRSLVLTLNILLQIWRVEHERSDSFQIIVLFSLKQVEGLCLSRSVSSSTSWRQIILAWNTTITEAPRWVNFIIVKRKTNFLKCFNFYF